MPRKLLWALIPLSLLAVLLGLWIARARLASELAENYFHQHGIASAISFGSFGLSGVSGRVALGPAEAPDFSADAVEVDFDPLSFVPRIVSVRLVNPVVRARIDQQGHVTLPSLQAWLDSLSTGEQHSRYVSDDLAISFSHLRALLITPGGAVEVDGDAKIQHGAPISAALTLQPAQLAWRGVALRLASADVKLDATAGGYGVLAHLKASLKTTGLEAGDLTAEISAPQLRWDDKAGIFTAPALSIKAVAAALNSNGLAAAHPALTLNAQDLRVSLSGDGAVNFTLQAGADFAPDIAGLPVVTRDKKLTQALSTNLRHLDLGLDAGLMRQGGRMNFAIHRAATIKGAGGGLLTLAALKLTGTPDDLQGGFTAALSGPGLPAFSLNAQTLRWRDGALTTKAAIRARFDFDMMRGAEISGNGAAAFQNGTFTFTLSNCAPATLAAFHPGAADMAQKISGRICAAPNEKTFTADATGWKFSATAEGAAMNVPLGNVIFTGGAGHLAFSGKGAAMTGKVSVTAARMTDATLPRRFEPVTGTGEILLDNWIWHGQFAVADGTPLGTASFSHAMETGAGSLTINAPNLQFSPGKLQPVLLSPLLGAVTRADGAARFDGAIGWTRTGFESHGTLGLDRLDFLTPLGTAHAINATIVLASLLPPVTAPGQHIAIQKVDWTLPLSGIAIDFSFGGGALKIESLSSEIAEGNLRLGALNIDLTGPRTVAGAASLDSIALGPLVAASNLGDKIKLDGKVTGTVPFTFGPDGFRIVNGHLAATGPGRISLSRSVWEAGGATAANAVQDLAYQAMENLAFDQLSADINSIAGGRLQVVFHIKGHSDPPKPQQAEVAVADIINGSALQKPIALPSNTPIDLTLDTSLNFDELLRSYGEAWSKTIGLVQ